MSFFFYNYIITPFTKSFLFLVTSFLFFSGPFLVLINIFSGAYSVQGVGKHMTFCFVLYPFSNNLQYFECCIGIFMNDLSYREVLFLNFNELLRNNNFISAAAIFIFLCA